MPSTLPQFTGRIDPKLLDKMKYIADAHCRSLSKEVGLIVKQEIDSFEKEHGVIEVPEEALNR